MYKNEKELDTWLDALLEPQRAELPSNAWNQLREELGQSSPEELISQVTSNDKTTFPIRSREHYRHTFITIKRFAI